MPSLRLSTTRKKLRVNSTLHNLFYDEIVIGASLGALMYSFTTGAPVFSVGNNKPHKFDYFKDKQDIDFLLDPPRTLNTPSGPLSLGQQKLALWEKLYFILNLCGLMPTAHIADSLRFTENELKIFNEYSKITTVNFNKAVVFDGQKTNLKIKKEPNRFLILDWISIHSGGRHDVDLIETEDQFVSKLWFYDSARVPSKIKDMCAISFIDESDLDAFECSDTYARFKAEDVMKKHGMRGASNGVDKKTGKNKYYAIKTSCLRRDRFPLNSPDIVESASIVNNKKSEFDLLIGMAPANDKIANTVRKLCI